MTDAEVEEYINQMANQYQSCEESDSGRRDTTNAR